MLPGTSPRSSPTDRIVFFSRLLQAQYVEKICISHPMLHILLRPLEFWELFCSRKEQNNLSNKGKRKPLDIWIQRSSFALERNQNYSVFAKFLSPTSSRETNGNPKVNTRSSHNLHLHLPFIGYLIKTVSFIHRNKEKKSKTSRQWE